MMVRSERFIPVELGNDTPHFVIRLDDDVFSQITRLNSFSPTVKRCNGRMIE
ncbi:hypothetical protein [Exiguobacterium sp. TNDT2]|uniref:hypothetical protein n=1 Tax=Exiguobacterium sp. TNDT2 TaxID=2233531 RepID=UPI00130080A1|nr:hypothetical protein [Exiguobacterium sp. TNDT2]